MLTELWEAYAQLVRKRNEAQQATQKKHDVLDMFLWSYFSDSGSTDQIMIMRDTSTMCNQLSQEFMGDIVTVTTGSNSEDDSTLLQHYLLQDRGWMLLHVIRDVGVKGLCNSRELCNLLVSLLPWCCQFHQSENLHHSFSDQEILSITYAFTSVLKLSKLKPLGCQKESRNNPKSSDQVHHYHKHKRSTLDALKVHNNNDDDDDDSEKESIELGDKTIKNKPARFKRKSQPFVRNLTSPKDDDGYSDDDILASFDKILKPDINFTAADLVKLVLDITNELSKLDLVEMSPGKSLSSSILPHLLHLLTEQFSFEIPESIPKNTDNSETQGVKQCAWQMKIKCITLKYLLRSIFLVSSLIATHQHGVKILNGHGIIPKVLNFLLQNFKLTDSQLRTDKLVYSIVEDIISGCIILFEIVFQNLPFNPSYINEALGLLKTFEDCDGFQYIRYIVEVIDGDIFGVVSKLFDSNDNIVKYIGNFIHTLKTLKVNYIHAVKCLKHRHRNCEYSVYYDHHHGVLGVSTTLKSSSLSNESAINKDNQQETESEPIKFNKQASQVEDIFKRTLSEQSKSNSQSVCAVATWSNYLLDLIQSVKHKRMQVQILTTLTTPGVCCCIQPKRVIDTFVPILSDLTPAMSNFYLETLITLLLDNFQGTKDPTRQQSLCQQCFLPDDISAISLNLNKAMILDSGFSSSEISEANHRKALQRWRPLRQLRNYVLYEDPVLALTVSKGLIVLAFKGNSAIKEELFFGMYQQILQSIVSDMEVTPVDVSSNDETASPPTQVPTTIMLYCVSALPYVLQVDKVMKAFLDNNGLTRLHDLIEDEHLRTPVLGVFEALIMIDEQNFQRSKSGNDAAITNYPGGIVMQNFIDVLARKTCNITSALQMLHINKELEKSGEVGHSECSVKHESEETLKPKTDNENECTVSKAFCQVMKHYHQDMLNHLPLLLDMWQTCAKLCINSPTFRNFYKCSPSPNSIVIESLVLSLELLVEIGSKEVHDHAATEPNEELPDSPCKIFMNKKSFSCHQSKLAFIEAVMIVCFSCQTISGSQKKGNEEVLWKRLLSSLLQCTELEPTKLRTVFEMLLNTALPQIPSILEYSYPQIVSLLNLREEDWEEEDELRLIRQQTSESDQDTMFTEHGYEADTEGNTQEDWKIALDTKPKVVHRSNNLCFPAVFRLIVEMLIVKPEPLSRSAIMIPGLLRLYQVLKSSKMAVEAVCKEGLLEIILDGFKEKLICRTGTQQDVLVREVLLSLIQLMAQQQLSAKELSQFFDLFKCKDNNIDSLLSMFLGIVENSHIHPSHTLQFPVPATSDSNTTDQIILEPYYTDDGEKKTGSKLASNGVIQWLIKDGLTWPPLQTGFSLSMWLRPESLLEKNFDHRKSSSRSSSQTPDPEPQPIPEIRPRSSSFNSVTPSEYVHVLSLGNLQKRFEVWIDGKSTSLIFRISTAYSDYGLLAETVVDDFLSFSKWQHLVISYKESLDGSTQLGKKNMNEKNEYKIFWSSLPGLPKIAKWPVNIVAWTLVQLCLLIQIMHMSLKRKPQTFNAFQTDVQWALGKHSGTKKRKSGKNVKVKRDTDEVEGFLCPAEVEGTAPRPKPVEKLALGCQVVQAEVEETPSKPETLEKLALGCQVVQAEVEETPSKPETLEKLELGCPIKVDKSPDDLVKPSSPISSSNFCSDSECVPSDSGDAKPEPIKVDRTPDDLEEPSSPISSINFSSGSEYEPSDSGGANSVIFAFSQNDFSTSLQINTSSVTKTCEEVPESDESPELGEKTVKTKVRKQTSHKVKKQTSLNEEEIERDVNFPNIYVRKVMLSKVSKLGKKKKNEHVWNPAHSCLFCHKVLINISKHLIKHKNEKEVQEIKKLGKTLGKRHKMMPALQCLLNQLTLLVNGWMYKEFSLDHPASAYRKDIQVQPSVYIGCAHKDDISKQLCRYMLGPVMIFKGSDYSREWWHHLYTLGLNCTSISKCDCTNTRTNYSQYISKDVVCHGKLSYDVLVGSASITDVDKARSSIVLSYLPRYSQSVCYFSPKNQPSHSSLQSGTAQDSLLYQHPTSITCNVTGKLTVLVNDGFEKAAQQTGGIGAFLFLVAKIYEFSDENSANSAKLQTEKLQSKAIRQLFIVIYRYPRLMEEFNNLSGYAMLQRLLTSSKSIVGYEILKTLLDACTSESVFRPDAACFNPVLRKGTEAIVRDIYVIDQLLLHWRVWENADTGVTELLFQALKLLVREDHPYRDFNIKQFQAGNVLNKIFSIYLERIRDNLPSLSVVISKSVSHIVQAILGNPPDLHMLMTVTDFLLLVHPAANSFINYSTDCLYFKSWWADPKLTTTPPKKIRSYLEKSSNYSDSADSDGLMYNKRRRRGNRISDLSISSHGGDADHSKTDTESEPSVDYPKVQKLPQSSETAKSLDSEDGLGMCKSLNGSYSAGSLDEIDRPDGTEPPGKKEGEVNYREEQSEILEKLLSERQGDDAEYDDNNEMGLSSLCAGLLNYLSEIMVDLPDSSVEQTFSKILNPGCLIVLAQNHSPYIKAAVINLLGSYLIRAPSLQQDSFLKMDGFYLLANQLHLHIVTSDHVEAAISIFLGKPYQFEQHVDFDEFKELTAVQQSSIVLLLSLVEKTADDMAVCHNTLTFILQLVQCISVMSSVLIEYGICEVLCNLLSVLNQSDSGDIDIDGIKENQLLYMDIQDIFCAIAVREFSWSSAVHYQQLEELFNLLYTLEKTEISSSKRLNGPDTVLGIQLAMLTHILEYVEGASEDLSKQSVGWFSTTNSNSANIAGYGKTTLRRPAYLQHHPAHAYSDPNFSASLPFPTLFESSLADDTHMRSQTPPLMTYHFTDNPYEDKGLVMSGYVSGESDSSTDSSRRPSRWTSLDSSGKVVSSSTKLTFFGTRRKKLVFTSISQTELLERFKKILVMATDLVIFCDRSDIIKPEGERSVMFSFTSGRQIKSQEDEFLTLLFNFTFRALEMTLEKSMFGRKNKNVIMWGAKDVVRVQLGRLLCCFLSPKMEFDQRVYVMSYLMGEPRGREILKLLVSNQQVSTEVCYNLYNLLSMWHDWLTKSQREHGYLAVNVLRMYGCTIYSPEAKLSQDMADTLTEDKRSIDSLYEKEKKVWTQKRESCAMRILTRFDKLEHQISDQAMTVTQKVTHLQNLQRKKLINHIKKSMTEGIQIKKAWQELVQNLTHERAVWFHEDSYPISWQLDPTEGPGRMRKRLQRGHLGIKDKFLTANFKATLAKEKPDPPLKFLFEDDHPSSDSAALIYRLYTNEKIQHTCRCMAVAPATESKGDLLVGEMCIFFVSDEAITDTNYTQVLLGNKDELSMTWPHVNIRELHKRWYQLQDVGLEIFLTNGKTCLLAFLSPSERDELYNFLLSLELPNLMITENLDDIRKMWLDGLITNYDYLIYLNKIAGRSFSDLMQYPVFPFILREYESEVLDLEDASVYRDLSKPIAIQDKSREKKYSDNYEFLQQEYDKNIEIEHLLRVPPYHYGSHYSNSGTVLHYLVRLPPFTQMFLSYQDGSFDIPDRTFHSMRTSWRLSSFESQTDVKELIPEFFFLPEFLKNNEGFDFGRRQNGEAVSNVSLPPWCSQDARLFVLINRQALESAYVTQRIHQWIDLVFGYKQQGEMAKKSFNVFHPSTYFGFDVSKIKDPLRRQALLTMIKTYGQTPKQVFRSPHAAVQKSSDSLLSQFFLAPSSPINDNEEKSKTYCPRPIKTVSGLKWGNYVGSPEYLPPVPTWMETYPTKITSLIPLSSGLVFGVPAHSCVLVLNSKERDLLNTSNAMWAAIFSWKDRDGVTRISHQLKQSVNFLNQSPYDEITCCASVPDCHLLFIASNNGVINVYHTAHNSAKASEIQVFGNSKSLYGHTAAVTSLYICNAFSVVVSGSEDTTCIIWDLNRLCYVTSIKSHESSIKALAVSDTLGDVISVSQKGDESVLFLHSVNGHYISSQTCEEGINCLAYSYAPEGRSVNVIAGGLNSGVVRLWSSWDLTAIRDLRYEKTIATPIISITFSLDSQRLYVSASDGSVIIWEKQSSRHRKDTFIPLLGPQKLGKQ